MFNVRYNSWQLDSDRQNTRHKQQQLKFTSRAPDRDRRIIRWRIFIIERLLRASKERSGRWTGEEMGRRDRNDVLKVWHMGLAMVYDGFGLVESELARACKAVKHDCREGINYEIVSDAF